jgi:hypothetical protein
MYPDQNGFSRDKTRMGIGKVVFSVIKRRGKAEIAYKFFTNGESWERRISGRKI